MSLLRLLCLAPLGLAQQPAQVPFTSVTDPSGFAPTPRPSVWWGDYDADGRDDAWVVQPTGGGKLLRNDGRGAFEDVTVRAGLADAGRAHMAAWGDANGDGRLDLYLPVLGGKSRLYLQNEAGVFLEATERSGLPPFVDPLQARWIEVDGDGLPELWLTTAIDDLLYANRGALGFQRVDLFTEPRDPWLEQLAAAEGVAPGSAGLTTQSSTSAPGAACLPSIMDQAFPGTCLGASSDPVLGELYPLSSFLFVQAGTGRVGINTTAPTAQLDVQGSIQTSQQLVSTTTASAPLLVSSSTKVVNLNADLLDGLSSAAFATVPVDSAEIADGSITGLDVADGSLTGDDIANDSIVAAQIATNAIGTLEIADGSVTTLDIALDTITAADLAASSVGNSELAANAVTTDKVLDGTLTGADLAANSITAAEIAADAVGSSEIANGSVTSADIATDTITAADIADGAVRNAELGINAVTTDKIFNGTILAEDLATDSVGSAQIAASAVGTSEIANGSIEYFDLASPLDGTTAGTVLWVQNDTTGTQGKAIQAETSASGGVALEALALDTGSGVTYGVKGLSAAANGYGVWGRANGTGTNFGVFGETYSGSGTGVQGVVSATTGSGTSGVHGLNSCTSGLNYGVLGESSSNTGVGVQGTVSNASGINSCGLRGWNLNPANQNYGVWGEAASPSGRGVFGYCSATTGTNYGVRGQSASSTGYGLSAIGDLIATGTKSFVQPHPSDPSRQIRFVCLEGNESGTYFRGSAKVEGSLAVIEVPEEFRLVTEERGLTVQLTALGPNTGLWVESKGLDRIVVRATEDVEFDYLVNGVRRGFADIDLVRPNTEFVPSVRGVPFGTQYPQAMRDLLVRNGILNPDYTPNEATAQALGWTLVEPELAQTLPIER